MKKKENNHHIKTKRLVLVPLEIDELRRRVENEPDDEMKKALGDMLSGCEANPDGALWYTEWQMRLKTTGEFIGSLDFKGPPNEYGEVEIGYGTDEAYRCQGYTTEAARALIDWAFSQAEGMFFAMAETAPDNSSSQRVLEKLGFKPTGISGEEGPLFELERPKTAFISVFMCLGMSVGVSLGTSVGNMGLTMCLGVAIGAALGASIDAQDKKKREDIRAGREKRRLKTCGPE